METLSLNHVPQYIVSGLTNGSIYSIIALGFSLIYNASRIVNFAQGEFVMIGALMTISLSQERGLPLWLSALLAIMGTVLVGLFLESCPLRKSRSKSHLVLVMITVGVSICIQGSGMLIWGKDARTLPPLGGYEPLQLFNASFLPQTVFIIVSSFALFLILHLFFHGTIIGKAIRALAEDPEGASMAGVPVNRLVTFSFGLSGGLGALAGVLITPLTTMSYQCGLMLGLKGFSAAVFGGFGSFAGAIVGGLLLGLMESIGAGVVSSAYKDAIAFFVLLLILFLRPRGIMGETRAYRL